MQKTRHLVVAAVMALTASTAPAPASNAPDWPEPARTGDPTLSRSDLDLDTDAGAEPVRLDAFTITALDNAAQPAAGAGDSVTKTPPWRAGQPARTVSEVETDNQHPPQHGSFTAISNSHDRTTIPHACPCQGNGSRLGRQHRKEAPEPSRRT